MQEPRNLDSSTGILQYYTLDLSVQARQIESVNFPVDVFRIEGGRGNKNKSTPCEIFMTNREETNNQIRFLPLHPLGKKKKKKKKTTPLMIFLNK
jgi:hypothetical protein